ncbi:MAG: cytochrome c biogenesis protein CcdA [Gemmatimonas sp.]|nr:cytochrome c biogenesis protein CcdA [Gemmatimonas sp.]
MEAQSLGLAVAFTAGLLSFLSPCVLPLIPSYVTFITGMSLDELTAEDTERRRVRRTVLLHGSLFIVGFTLVFVVLGASVTFMGSLFNYASQWVERVGGALLIVFGLYLLGVLRVPGAAREWRVNLGNKPLGYLGTVLVGVTFGAGWTPCIGPVLGGILTIAATRGSVSDGVGLLFVYSLGLAVPFLLAALLLQRFLGSMKHVGPWLPWISRISGALLLVIGVMMLTGTFTALTALLARFTPDVLFDRL